MPGFEPASGETVLLRQRCRVCDLLVRDPVQTIEEGYRICRSCSRNWPGFTDKAFAREEEYLRLRIKCSNSISGCSWEGQLKLVKEHYNTCQFTPVEYPCHHDGCTVIKSSPSSLHRHRLACPFRSVLCGCGREMAPNEMRHHWEHCPDYGDHYYNQEESQSPVLEEASPQMVMVDMSDNFPFTSPVQEEEQVMGELVVGRLHRMLPQRNYVPVQEQDRLEGELVLTRLRPLQRVLPLEVNRLLHSVQSARRLEPEQSSQIFFQMVTPQQDHAAGEATELVVATHRPLHRARTQRLLQQLQNARLEQCLPRLEHRLRDLEQQVYELAQGVLTLILHANSGKKLRRITQLEKMLSGLQLQRNPSTHNGSFKIIWRIPDISQRRKDATERRITSIYSPPFYTGRPGYKMCIRAYLNGDGIGYKTHLSIFFVLMKGEYDSLLKWPFESKVSLILVDQNHRKHIIQTFKPTPESSSFQQPHSDMNIASGCPQFARVTVLEDENYVKDDVLYIKCTIDTSRFFCP